MRASPLRKGSSPSAEDGSARKPSPSRSVYVALTAPNFEDALPLAVSHSGDSDSTGSLVGNILGATLGVEAIPPRWLEALELRTVIERVAQDLVNLRSGSFDAEAEWGRYPGG